MQKGETKQAKAASLRENPLNFINLAQMIQLEKLQGPLKQALKADNTIEKELSLFKLICLWWNYTLDIYLQKKKKEL